MAYDTIIIGGGISGMSAALYLLRNNKKVLLLEKESFGGQISNSPRVENYPTIKSISGPELSDLLFSQIQDLGVEFDIADVSSIQKCGDGDFVVKSQYREYKSHTVLLANGVSHRLTHAKNEEKFLGNGISFCALCDGPFIKGNDAHIIGDANSALQYALLLCDYCPKVHIYALFDRLFGEETIINKIKNNPQIDITYNVSLQEYIGENKLEGLLFKKTTDESLIKVDTNNVFLCIGQVPNNDAFAHYVDLDNGYIVTNDDMETKIPGLFASGDTRKKRVRQLVTASNDGAIAALSIINYLNSL